MTNVKINFEEMKKNMLNDKALSFCFFLDGEARTVRWNNADSKCKKIKLLTFETYYCVLTDRY